MVNEAPKTRFHGEAILCVLALLSAALVIAVTVLCIPYFREKKAPPAAIATIPEQEEETEYTEPPETIEPTIPPERNIYNRRDFQYNRHNYLYCTRQTSYPGVDVSAFQGNIDWKKVRQSGILFAMVRLGYRGWGQAGKMKTDEYVEKNLKEAKEAGIALGAYFFSQALTVEEVDEEIAYMLEILGDTQLEMPLVLDWEPIHEEGSRSQNMDRRTLTDLLLHYCKKITELGYQTMIYFNPNQANAMLYLNELEEYPFWLAMYTDRMNYPFRVDMWQYSCKGTVPGITGDVDLNVYIPEADAIG